MFEKKRDGTVKSTDPDDAQSPYLFTARRWEKELKLYYFRNRYYSPDLGRLISLDPLDYVDGMNFYAYVNGNTVNLVDPMGLDKTKVNYRPSASRNIFELSYTPEKLLGLDQTPFYVGPIITGRKNRNGKYE